MEGSGIYERTDTGIDAIQTGNYGAYGGIA